MKATPVNLLNTGRPMRKCSRCRRLKAVFPSSTSEKAHGGVSDLCWTCSQVPRRKEVKRQETTKETETPARTGRPNEGSVWRRGGIWYAVITRDGKTRRVSSGSQNRAVAERLLARLLAEPKLREDRGG